jgi:hypothetical protein
MQAQYGTVSQANLAQGGQFVGANGPKGESLPGSQRVVANASHWWLQNSEDEPLPGCNVPVYTTTWVSLLVLGRW